MIQMPSCRSPRDVFIFLKERNPQDHLADIMPGRIVKANQKLKSYNGRTRRRTRTELS